MCGFIGDAFGSKSEPAGGKYFLVIICANTAGKNETGFAIASERLLENSGELAIPIGDIRVLQTGQGFDDVP